MGVCLAFSGQFVPPSPMEKAELSRAGLGPRKLSLNEYGDSREFHDAIVSAFPKLTSAGGYELMWTMTKNVREWWVQ